MFLEEIASIPGLSLVPSPGDESPGKSYLLIFNPKLFSKISFEIIRLCIPPVGYILSFKLECLFFFSFKADFASVSKSSQCSVKRILIPKKTQRYFHRKVWSFSNDLFFKLPYC